MPTQEQGSFTHHSLHFDSAKPERQPPFSDHFPELSTSFLAPKQRSQYGYIIKQKKEKENIMHSLVTARGLTTQKCVVGLTPLRNSNSLLTEARMERLVEVTDPEVRIDFALNCKCRANVHLRSLSSTSSIAFKVQTSSPHKFLVNPPTGLIPPLSYATFQVILKPQTQFPQTYPRSPSDRFLIKTAEFTSTTPDSTHPDYVNAWFSSRSHVSTHDLKLKVYFVGPMLLNHAVSCGDCDAVRNLIKRQRSILPELSPAESKSLLRVACELADSGDMVNLLLEAGLRVDPTVDSDDQTSQLDPKWSSKGWKALHVAAAFDRMDEISNSVKVRGPGSLDCRDKEGRTPLHVAVSKANIRCATLLVECGADKDAVSKDGRTALYRAAANGDRQIVEMLIEMGADPRIADDRGRSPVDIAREKGHNEIVETLELGEAVLKAARKGESKQLESLIQKGANIKFQDQYGLTALHAAAIKGHVDVICKLLEHGFDSECRDEEGHAPLHLAAMSGSLASVEALVKHGANINSGNGEGLTPLHMAKAMGNDEISGFLVSNGASASLPLPNSSSS